ncbi:MAG: hypothetical protein AAFU61_11105, partial [Pseudomonadota bacterium]
GCQREIFDAEARRLIHLAARGTPRLINQLADYALVYAFAEERDEVGGQLVREVLNDRRQYGVFSDPDAPDAPQPEPVAATPERSHENVFYGTWDRQA